MKIAQSLLTLQSGHAEKQQTERSESLRVWIGNQRPDFEGAFQGSPPAVVRDTVTISQEAFQRSHAIQRPVGVDSIPEDDGLYEDANLRALRLTIEAMTGRELRVDNLRLQSETVEVPQQQQEAASEAVGDRAGWGVEYDFSETYTESEETTFSGSGTILTQDGREISFATSFSLHRDYSISEESHIRLGDAKLVDPLVLNFDGSANLVQSGTFAFDLDGDGSNEEINRLGTGSGFLFLDKNGDGQASNGTELFGPQSGHGFGELAQLDQDQNGWIDENDSSFHALRIWQQDQDGKDIYTPLGLVGIGALSLGSMETEFTFKNGANTTYGKLQETSLFLKENGGVGTMHELDFAV